MTFNLSGSEIKERVFLAKRSELEGRLDPGYVRYLRKSQSFVFPTRSFGSILKCRPQYGANEPGIPRKDTGQPRYIRITDIDEFGVLSQELGASAANIEDKYVLVEGDLLLARSGNTVGKAYLHTSNDYSCFFAGYMIRFKINAEIALPSYIFTVTQLGIYKDWVNAVQRSAGQPNINAEEYRNYKLPLPPLDVQQRIVAKMNTAYATKKQKEAQAQQLLDSFPTLLLKYAGIEIPKLIYRKSFYILSQALDGPLNPERYSVSFEEHDSWVPIIQSGEVVYQSICPSSALNKEKQFSLFRIDDLPSHPIDAEFRTISGKDTSGNFQEIAQGDLLISRLGPTIENAKFIIAPETDNQSIGSNEFIVFRCNNSTIPLFVLGLLRTHVMRQLMMIQSRGAVPSRRRLSRFDFTKLRIPIVDIRVQRQIADEYMENIRKAKQLRVQASAGLEQAKQEVEAMILGVSGSRAGEATQ